MSKLLTLKKNYEFNRVYKKGRFFVGNILVIYVIKNRFAKNRFGISASKKFGNAVKRNRMRRILKESIVFYEPFVKEGYDIVFVAHKQSVIPNTKDVLKEMKFLFKKTDVYNKENEISK